MTDKQRVRLYGTSAVSAITGEEVPSVTLDEIKITKRTTYEITKDLAAFLDPDRLSAQLKSLQAKAVAEIEAEIMKSVFHKFFWESGAYEHAKPLSPFDNGDVIDSTATDVSDKPKALK